MLAEHVNGQLNRTFGSYTPRFIHPRAPTKPAAPVVGSRQVGVPTTSTGTIRCANIIRRPYETLPFGMAASARRPASIPVASRCSMLWVCAAAAFVSVVAGKDRGSTGPVQQHVDGEKVSKFNSSEMPVYVRDCYVQYCTEWKDLRASLCEGNCSTNDHAKKCHRHWLGAGHTRVKKHNIQLRAKGKKTKTNPGACVKIRAIKQVNKSVEKQSKEQREELPKHTRRCFNAYCNDWQDLKEGFCKGQACTTNTHAMKCSSHWRNEGHRRVKKANKALSKKRYVNPVACAKAAAIKTIGDTVDQQKRGGPDHKVLSDRERNCYNKYCNEWKDLSAGFCKGTCNSNDHALKCKTQWQQKGLQRLQKASANGKNAGKQHLNPFVCTTTKPGANKRERKAGTENVWGLCSPSPAHCFHGQPVTIARRLG